MRPSLDRFVASLPRDDGSVKPHAAAGTSPPALRAPENARASRSPHFVAASISASPVAPVFIWRGQPVDDRPPLALVDDFGGAVVGDDARIMLGERDIDENAVALGAMGDAAQDELFERGAMGVGAAQLARGVRRSRRAGSDRTPSATRNIASCAMKIRSADNSVRDSNGHGVARAISALQISGMIS